ncbi:MAG: copper amine oxidase N-terminal domain-containing protein [Clostridiales bacterium]|jgi:hypothetical protein|nr:copper amine oxidase N-terminal domain-containing protein [Clostridiales bacterium]
MKSIFRKSLATFLALAMVLSSLTVAIANPVVPFAAPGEWIVGDLESPVIVHTSRTFANMSGDRDDSYPEIGSTDANVVLSVVHNGTAITGFTVTQNSHSGPDCPEGYWATAYDWARAQLPISSTITNTSGATYSGRAIVYALNHVFTEIQNGGGNVGGPHGDAGAVRDAVEAIANIPTLTNAELLAAVQGLQILTTAPFSGNTGTITVTGATTRTVTIPLTGELAAYYDIVVEGLAAFDTRHPQAGAVEAAVRGIVAIPTLNNSALELAVRALGILDGAPFSSNVGNIDVLVVSGTPPTRTVRINLTNDLSHFAPIQVTDLEAHDDGGGQGNAHPQAGAITDALNGLLPQMPGTIAYTVAAIQGAAVTALNAIGGVTAAAGDVAVVVPIIGGNGHIRVNIGSFDQIEVIIPQIAATPTERVVSTTATSVRVETDRTFANMARHTSARYAIRGTAAANAIIDFTFSEGAISSLAAVQDSHGGVTCTFWNGAAAWVTGQLPRSTPITEIVGGNQTFSRTAIVYAFNHALANAPVPQHPQANAITNALNGLTGSTVANIVTALNALPGVDGVVNNNVALVLQTFDVAGSITVTIGDFDPISVVIPRIPGPRGEWVVSATADSVRVGTNQTYANLGARNNATYNALRGTPAADAIIDFTFVGADITEFEVIQNSHAGAVTGHWNRAVTWAEGLLPRSTPIISSDVTSGDTYSKYAIAYALNHALANAPGDAHPQAGAIRTALNNLIAGTGLLTNANVATVVNQLDGVDGATATVVLQTFERAGTITVNVSPFPAIVVSIPVIPGPAGEWIVRSTGDSVTTGTNRTFANLATHNNYTGIRGSATAHVVLTANFRDYNLVGFTVVQNSHPTSPTTCWRWNDAVTWARGIISGSTHGEAGQWTVLDTSLALGNNPGGFRQIYGLTGAYTYSAMAIAFALNHAYANPVAGLEEVGGGDPWGGAGTPGVTAPPPTAPGAGVDVGVEVPIAPGDVIDLIEGGEDFVIEEDGVTVTIPSEILADIFADENLEEVLVELNVSPTSEEALEAGQLLRVEVNIVIGEGDDAEFVAETAVAYSVSVALDPADILADDYVNTYRVTAVTADGRLVGGTFDAEAGIFTFETQLTGEFVIAYVEDLKRFGIGIGSAEVEDFAGTLTEEVLAEVANVFVPPVLVDGRTLIPVRAIAYLLGAEVGWDDAARQVTLTINPTISFPIGTLTPQLEALGMDVPAQIMYDRTMVPVRFIGEFFGAVVGWDGETQSVELTMLPPGFEMPIFLSAVGLEIYGLLAEGAEDVPSETLVAVANWLDANREDAHENFWYEEANSYNIWNGPQGDRANSVLVAVVASNEGLAVLVEFVNVPENMEVIIAITVEVTVTAPGQPAAGGDDAGDDDAAGGDDAGGADEEPAGVPGPGGNYPCPGGCGAGAGVGVPGAGPECS